MKLITAILLATVLVGCTAPWRDNPITGKTPIEMGVEEAIEAAPEAIEEGDWRGGLIDLGIAFAVGLLSGMFGPKTVSAVKSITKKKD